MKHPRLGLFILLLQTFVWGRAFAFTFQPTASTSTLTAVNTSVAKTWTGTLNGKTTGDAAAGNISRVPITNLLPAGIPVIAEMQSWFCQPGNTDPLCSGGHISVGYNSADKAQIQKQVTDQKQRGITGQNVDWYGSSQLANEALDNLRPIAEATPGFSFAVTIDKGFFTTGSSTCGNSSGLQCTCTDQTSCTKQAISGINYIVSRWGGSHAYMKGPSGRPLVFWFLNKWMNMANSSTPIITTINWSQVASQVRGNPQLIFLDQEGFTDATTSGSYGWVNPADDVVNGTPVQPDPDRGFKDAAGFYALGLQHPTLLTYGEAYKGFNDGLASWGLGRVIDQQCGQTWLDTFTFSTGAFTSKGGKMQAMMIDTWDDYEEGTETETGIDNCMNDIKVSVSSNVVSWSPQWGKDPMNSSISGTENTVYQYNLFLALHGQSQLMPIKTLMCTRNATTGQVSCPHSYDTMPLGIIGGPFDVYVQAIGQPGLKNHLSLVPAYFTQTAAVVSASYVSQTVPAIVTAGQTYHLSVRMQNDGTVPWKSAGVDQYGIGSQNPQDNSTWGGRVYMSTMATVGPGSTYSFTFNAVAPSTPGLYNFQWRMLQEHVNWFGGMTPNVVITVQKSNAPAANFVAADLSNCRVYPNPWRSDRHSDKPITFDNLTLTSTIKIFTVSGHWVKTLSAPSALVTWDLTNDSGDKVASGTYVYVIKDDQGQKKTGELAIIK